jgi:hypothetical protein
MKGESSNATLRAGRVVVVLSATDSGTLKPMVRIGKSWELRGHARCHPSAAAPAC